MKKRKLNPKLQAWIDARKRHRLPHAHVQMAREFGMNPKTLGKIDNHKQQPWKAPLSEFISFLYEKRFGRRRPENVLSIEALARKMARQADARRRAKPSVGWRGAVPKACRLTAKQIMGAQSHE
jgi:SOS-response transcriptional repressor LexA